MKRLPAALAVCCLIVTGACALAPAGASPVATPPPSAPSSMQPTQSAAPPQRTATDAQSQTPGATPISTPSVAPQSTAVIVRINWTGGFVPPSLSFTNYPTASLYADGRLIVPGGQPTVDPAPAVPTLAQTQISPAGLATILDWARQAGLTGADRTLGQPVPDVGQIEYTVTYPDGTSHTTTAYPVMGDASPDPAMQALLDFQSKLLNVSSSLPAEDVGDSGAYSWDRLRVISWSTGEDAPDPTQTTARDWPLESLATLGSQEPNLDYRCAAISGADLATLMPALEGANSATLWKSDRKLYQVVFHPLLPDDPDCSGGNY
jgi:hypothetical protein